MELDSQVLLVMPCMDQVDPRATLLSNSPQLPAPLQKGRAKGSSGELIQAERSPEVTGIVCFVCVISVLVGHEELRGRVHCESGAGLL